MFEISSLAIPIMVIVIIIFGQIKRINVYECFVEGARETLPTAINIFCPLIALVTAIAMFRNSGLMEMTIKILRPVTDVLKIPSEIIPIIVTKPISGSASLATFNDLLKNHSADSLIGKIASVMMCSTETTFYVLSVYYGAIGNLKYRHAVKSAIFSDVIAILSSVYITKTLLG